ncbi:MAG: FapA family protein [Oscillospiraceae bacterium]|nr:FapA family protein [Oscillospiraceae bacterium]
MKKLRTRYFSASSREAAEDKAAEYFGHEKNRIIFEVVKDGAEDNDWQIFAFAGTAGELSNMDAGYGLFYEQDGVYLEFYKERGDGALLDVSGPVTYLSKKNISGLEDMAMRSVASKRAGRAKIAPAQAERFIGEDISVNFSADEMDAFAKLVEPEPGGADITLEAAKQKAEASGVVFGLDEKALDELIKAKDYGKERVIAAGALPVDGENGSLTYHFRTDERTARPMEMESGKVDYKQLDLFEPVGEGQILVTRALATEGTPGTTVKGKALKQKPGKDVVFPKGKNVDINEEKTEMRAKSSGLVELIGSSVNVSNIYKIDGDVGPAVGNIDFDGSVQVSGNVLAGHVIKASGGVSIGGVVEASEIVAGGSVEVKRGMQGMDKGNITAGGAISILYIERGKAVAGGSITVDASIHSTLEAGKSLYAKGKRGSIIGGRAAAGGDIEANSIGSVSHAQTEVEVGAMPNKRARMTFLENDKERIDGEMVKLDQLDAYLEKAKDKLDVATYDKLYRSGVENRRANTELLDEYLAEMALLKRELDEATNGKVHVFETTYPGTRITIATESYKVNDEIEFSTFKFREGQITYTACEAKKGG